MMLFVVIVSVSALQAPPATVRRVPVRATISEEPTMGKLAAFTLTAIPVFIAPSLLSLIDTAIVGRHSSLELAAMGPACAVVDSISGLFVFVSVGATNAVSSAETLGIARTSASAGAVVATALGTLVGGALAVAASPARFAGPIAAPCAAYVRIRAVGMPAAVALMSAQASCLGAKDSESPARATLLASVVNVAGDLLLVPSMGIRGAAWATVFCQFAAAATCAKALAKNRLLEFPPKITKSELRKFFAFGGFMVVLLMKILTYNQAVALAAALGPASGAAHQVIYSLSRFCYTLGDTTGATAQAFLPPIIKDHNPEMVARVVGKICVTSCVVALASATTAIALPTLAPHFFTTDAAVKTLMREIAPIAGIGLLMHPVVVGLEGVLLANRDLPWLLKNYLLTGAASVLATLALARLPTLALSQIWLYLAAYQLARCSTFLHRVFFFFFFFRRQQQHHHQATGGGGGGGFLPSSQ